jgi:hypothetical protein
VTDVFEEVNESLRQDTALKWWKILLPYLIVAGVLVIGSVAVFEFMKAQRDSEIERSAKIYDTAMTSLEANDLPGARTSFEQLSQGNTGYAAIASQMVADIDSKLAADPAAIERALLTGAEKDKGVMGNLAILKAAYAKADTAPLADIEKLVDPLIKKGGFAGALARELVAAKALEAGDVARARAEYQALELELDAPEAMKQRAAQAVDSLPAAPAAATPAAPAAATAPAPATPAPATPAPAQPNQ